MKVMCARQTSSTQTIDSEREPLVSLIIITHNRLKMLRLTIESILRSTYRNLEIIVVDDASNDGTYEYITKHYPFIKIIRNRREFFPSFSREIAYRLSKGEYLMFIDDDCILLRDTISKLMNLMMSDPSIGVVGPAVYTLGRKPQCFGGRILPFFWCRNNKRLERKKIIDSDFVQGTAMMVRRTVLKRVGGWDYKNFPWHAEEVDLCLRIKRTGYRVVCYAPAKVIHLSTILIKVPNPTRAYYAAKSRIKFYKRYFGTPFFLLHFLTINIAITFFYTLLFALSRRFHFVKEYIRGVADGLR